ncbi:MAG: response regulator transcription factor [Chloroflexi bacterium]|nr:response regulator transcription factor [Actinomycetota bacterium]MCL5111105.1 response regulator transcription factor [Chloroflexota bacterium]
MATKVLVVDDEASLLGLVRGYLEREGFAVLTAQDGQAGLDLVQRERPDVIVLDVMLPGLDGVEVCRQVRLFSNAYVIMLTARAAEIDKIVGLSVGADDYLTKPFSPRELVARVKAMLRRPRGATAGADVEEPRPLSFGDLTLDLAGHRVLKGGAEVALTPLEYRLLTALAGSPGRVFTREQLLEKVWGYDFYGDDHVVDVHVASLRKKIEDDPARPRLLVTVRGAGYRFEPEGEAR